MPNSELNFELPTIDSDQDLYRWFAKKSPASTIRTFYLQEKYEEENRVQNYRIWVVVTTGGSGFCYVGGHIFRESFRVPGKPAKIVCVAVALAILNGNIKIDFDTKRRIVKVYGAPDQEDLNYPRETMLMEYCLGSILF